MYVIHPNFAINTISKYFLNFQNGPNSRFDENGSLYMAFSFVHISQRGRAHPACVVYIGRSVASTHCCVQGSQHSRSLLLGRHWTWPITSLMNFSNPNCTMAIDYVTLHWILKRCTLSVSAGTDHLQQKINESQKVPANSWFCLNHGFHFVFF